MKILAKSGTAIAAAAAALVITVAVAPAAQAEGDHIVKCFGLNACKGQGFSMMKKSTCMAKGGSTSRG